MAENPSDPRGCLLLARSYARVERFADSASAYRRAIELGTREVEVLAAYGEALIAASPGVVSPQARAAFAEALTDDSGNPRGRYHLGPRADGGRVGTRCLRTGGPRGSPCMRNKKK